MNGRVRGIVTATILGFLGAGHQMDRAHAAGCDKPASIRFRHGATSASVGGGVVRAEEVCWVLAARAGQTLDAQVTSPDGNVVFSLYRPGYSVRPASDGPDISGPTMPGAGEQDDATAVKATLPVSGPYLFVLGTTRGGGGEYRLRVSVR